jgi:hypothetical protein
MTAFAIPKGSVAAIRVSPVDHTCGISVCGEIVRWAPEEPGDGIVTFAVRGATEETLVSLPARAFDGLEVASDGLIDGIFVDALMTVWMEFDVGYVPTDEVAPRAMSRGGSANAGPTPSGLVANVPVAPLMSHRRSGSP